MVHSFFINAMVPCRRVEKLEFREAIFGKAVIQVFEEIIRKEKAQIL